jgi:hypothetical protein
MKGKMMINSGVVRKDNEMNKKAEDAVKFLRDDNLVWSPDFDAIRHKIADIIVEANTVTHPVILASIRELCADITSPVVLDRKNA